MKGLPKTSIPFATHAWCVATGCNEDLPCAANCWAKRDAARMANNPCEEIARRYRGLVEDGGSCGAAELRSCGDGERRWTGQINEFPEFLDAPGRLRDPAVIFVGTHCDLGLCKPNFIYRVFTEMKHAPKHEFLIVTKRWPQIALPSVSATRRRKPRSRRACRTRRCA